MIRESWGRDNLRIWQAVSLDHFDIYDEPRNMALCKFAVTHNTYFIDCNDCYNMLKALFSAYEAKPQILRKAAIICLVGDGDISESISSFLSLCGSWLPIVFIPTNRVIKPTSDDMAVWITPLNFNKGIENIIRLFSEGFCFPNVLADDQAEMFKKILTPGAHFQHLHLEQTGKNAALLAIDDLYRRVKEISRFLRTPQALLCLKNRSPISIETYKDIVGHMDGMPENLFQGNIFACDCSLTDESLENLADQELSLDEITLKEDLYIDAIFRLN
jgi:hypothetical protein